MCENHLLNNVHLSFFQPSLSNLGAAEIFPTEIPSILILCQEKSIKPTPRLFRFMLV